MTDVSHITCSWEGYYDPESGLDHYLVGMGIHEEDDSVMPFTKVPEDVIEHPIKGIKLIKTADK